MAKIAIAHIVGRSPLIQSRFHSEPKLSKELADAYEERTWRHKMHVDKDGFVVIPGIAFKRCLEEIAKYLGTQIPGRGKSTYTKHFESGVMVSDDVVLDIKAESVEPQWIFVNADGVRGSGKRVMKAFPAIPSGWKGTVSFEIFDDIITEDVFLENLKQAGSLIGVGSFRVRNGGFCGRFGVKGLEFSEVDFDKLAA